jgi:tRNA(fMet)-specific endonuclease VapC
VIHLLDADAVMAALHGESAAAVRTRMEAARRGGGTVAVSAVTLLQLRHRITKGPRRFEERAKLREFLAAAVAILAFDADDAAMAGELQFALEAARTPIDAYDLLIAAQALRRGATVVTAPTSALSRIPGLLLQDWRL